MTEELADVEPEDVNEVEEDDDDKGDGEGEDEVVVVVGKVDRDDDDDEGKGNADNPDKVPPSSALVRSMRFSKSETILYLLSTMRGKKDGHTLKWKESRRWRERER